MWERRDWEISGDIVTVQTLASRILQFESFLTVHWNPYKDEIHGTEASQCLSDCDYTDSCYSTVYHLGVISIFILRLWFFYRISFHLHRWAKRNDFKFYGFFFEVHNPRKWKGSASVAFFSTLGIKYKAMAHEKQWHCIYLYTNTLFSEISHTFGSKICVSQGGCKQGLSISHICFYGTCHRPFFGVEAF